MEYKHTLNLPQTDFPIRANLAKVEEEMLGKWENEDVYHKILESRKSLDFARDKSKIENRYILHDGPPYPNGDIHLGHLVEAVIPIVGALAEPGAQRLELIGN